MIHKTSNDEKNGHIIPAPEDFKGFIFNMVYKYGDINFLLFL